MRRRFREKLKEEAGLFEYSLYLWLWRYIRPSILELAKATPETATTAAQPLRYCKLASLCQVLALSSSNQIPQFSSGKPS
jgi:hypothetical protein